MRLTFRVFLFVMILLGQLRVDAQDLLTTQAPLPCLDKTFTIVAHVVRDSLGEANLSEADILEGIDSLNRFFSPICAAFEICEFNYIDNFQFDTLDAGNEEWEQMLTNFNRPKRINMYFVADQKENQLCGFASLNGVAQVDDVGILILKSCATPDFKTIPHEMGHFFNLLHTFEGADGPNPELVDGSNCSTTGDEVCDTPADPYVPGQLVTNYVDEMEGCRFINRQRDGNGDYFVPDVGNIMSYYQNNCRCGFTYEQYQRMANAYLTATEKLW